MVMRARYIHRRRRRCALVHHQCSLLRWHTLYHLSHCYCINLVMLRFSCVVLLLAALLMLWCGEAEAAPTFGLLLRLLANHNGTNVLADFAELGLQTKINALNQLADLIAIAANSTSSG